MRIRVLCLCAFYAYFACICVCACVCTYVRAGMRMYVRKRQSFLPFSLCVETIDNDIYIVIRYTCIWVYLMCPG